MGTYVIQRPVGVTDVAGVGSEVAAVRAVAVAMTAAGQPVAVLHATYVPAEQTCWYAVVADDPATVLETLRRAGISAARVLPARTL